MSSLSEARTRSWDVIVVGTGVGGGTVGWALARKGLKVLFVERGKAHTPESPAGAYPEKTQPRGMTEEQKTARLRESGRFLETITDVSTGHPHGFTPILGQGVGGSSALYGMVMERYFPSDFAPRQHFPDAGDSTVPERWPISYQQLAPYYVEAEKLYRVRGTVDPLRPAGEPRGLLGEPPPLSPNGKAMHQLLAAKGLHTYRLPTASEFVEGCPGCQGFLCGRSCKNDSYRVCVAPAVAEHGAGLLAECEVLRLEATKTEVTGVVCRQAGEEATLQAPVVVVGAGAFSTPSLLLRSASPEWPDGLANGSGMVGRNFMRHHVDLYVVFGERPREDINPKELAFNDFYLHGEAKLGTVQSFGLLPPNPVLASMLATEMRQNPNFLTEALVPFTPFITSLGGKLLENSTILAPIMEDLPYKENRVTPGKDGGYELSYQVRESERRRIKTFRRLMKQTLRGEFVFPIKQAGDNRVLGHACGSCRFGLDPVDSVLDGDNKAHELKNLYVVDSSFLPSSAGTNPSLTLAANALRVADAISKPPAA